MAGEFLRIVRGATVGADVRVDDEPVLLGREAEGAGYLGESTEVSRRHARLVRAPDGGLLIDDLGSLNGTLVNGERIDRAHRLSPGDTIRLGDVLLVVVDASGRTGQPTAYAANGAGPTSAAARGERSGEPARGARSRDLANLPPAAVAVGLLAIALVVFLLLR